MIRLARERSTIEVVDDQFGSPTFAGQLVKNTWLLIEKECEGTYHLSTKGIISWADFAEAIFERINEDITVHRVPSTEFSTKAERPFYSKLDTRKVEQVEGIRIEDWKTGLNRLLKQLTK